MLLTWRRGRTSSRWRTASLRLRHAVFAGLVLFTGVAGGQAPDFLNPQQKGAFQVNGISFLDFFGFTDPPKLNVPAATMDQMVDEIVATGANTVRFTLGMQVKTYTDNAYDPAAPFPLEGKLEDVLAFGRKLTARGIPCLMGSFSSVANIIAGATADTSRVNPTDRRAFMLQHIPRLVTLAQLAENMGCEYFQLFGDEVEHLAADPTLTDLWIQAVRQIRQVFSGRLITLSAWGERGGPYTSSHFPQLIALLDAYGIGFNPVFTNHADPTIDELVSSYRNNADGHDSLKALAAIHTLYGKPMLLSDIAFGSFKGANYLSIAVLFGQNPANQYILDYPEQVNLYEAFFRAMPALDPNWMLGASFNSIDRLPYDWKDAHMPPYLGSLGESLRQKPAMQTLTRAYQTSQPRQTPANGWWYSPNSEGDYYAIEAENGVVRLGSLTFSAERDPVWNWARCVRNAAGIYVGVAQTYSGGRALNAAPRQPTAVVDGTAITIDFHTAATATLRIGSTSVAIQRYQFSSQWASPMLNAPRTGWWDESAQSGRGYFFEVQGNTLFVAGLLYNAAGQPRWFISTGAVPASGLFSAPVSVCSSSSQPGACQPTADMLRITFKAPWTATLTLSQEPPAEIRRYRQSEIGWAGPSPEFGLPHPSFLGESATVNAGSYTKGVAPGLVATIFGTGLTRGLTGIAKAVAAPLPVSLRGTSVLVNGLPAPIFSIANINGLEQINFQVPWETVGQSIPAVPVCSVCGAAYPFTITTKPAVTIVVVNNGSVSAPLRAFIDPLQPALLALDGDRAIAVHSDYSLVTPESPAHAGETITLYGLGFGATTPAGATGIPAGSSPFSTISPKPVIGVGGRNAVNVFSGLSPGSVGLYQFNLVVPDGVGNGEAPAAVIVGGQASNVVSIPIRGGTGGVADLVRNGSFEGATSDWGVFVGSTPGFAGSGERTASTAHAGTYSEDLAVRAAGRRGDLNLFQRNLQIVKGTSYYFRFWAKGNAAGEITVVLQKGGGDFHGYGLGSSFTPGLDWQLYSATFIASETATDGQLSFFFGDQVGEVWIDSVSLLPIAEPAP